MKIVACLGTNCTGEKEFTAAVDDVCRRLSGAKKPIKKEG